MLILGLDPGVESTGYSILKVNGNNSYEALEFDLIKTPNGSEPAMRLYSIYKKLLKIMTHHKPDTIAIERLFFASNAKTAMRVSQACGVMMLAAARKNLGVVEYAPGTIKKAVTGNGRADKKDVQKSLRAVFGAKIRSQVHKKTHFDNAADALAVALCHAYTLKNS